MQYDSRQIEELVDDFLAKAKNEFSVADMFDAISEKISDWDPEFEDKLFNDLEQYLDTAPGLFRDTGDYEKFFPRRNFFLNKEFLAIPVQYELKHGVLIPGHRFAPFCCKEIYPSELTLRENGKSKPVKCKQISCPLPLAAVLHALLGSEQMMENFYVEDQRNHDILKQDNISGEIYLSAYDFGEFYKRHNFTFGDAIRFKIRNWETGKLDFEYLSQNDRDEKRISKWIDALDDVLPAVIDDHADYFDIPEQLAKAFFRSPDKLMDSPVSGIDEIPNRSNAVQLGFSGGRTVLTRKADASEDEDSSPPPGIMISEGATDSLQEILKDIKCPLRPAEIEAYILDEMFDGEASFDAFYSRCFDDLSLEFADDAQQAIFQNFVEELWEAHLDRYNRFNDDLKGPVRSRILELVEARNQWLREMQDIYEGTKAPPEESMKELAKAAGALCQMLELINTPDKVLPDSEVEAVYETLDKMEELQDQLMQNISTEMKKQQ